MTKHTMSRAGLACASFVLVLHGASDVRGGTWRPARAGDFSGVRVAAAGSASVVVRVKPRAVRGRRLLAEGVWGARHAALTVTKGGASVEYDCGHGKIDGRVVLDRAGRFDVRGTHEVEAGGPSQDVSIAEEGAAARPDTNRRAARYRGIVRGSTLRLTVTLTGTGQTLGTFVLTRGAEPRLRKCRA